MNETAVTETIPTIATETMGTEATTRKAATTDVDRWFLIHTHSKQEDRAESNLRVLGVQVFSPKVKERRYNQYTNAPNYVTKSLFPRYIFAQFSINDFYHKVRFTRGVYSVVSFGDGPTPIDEEVIALIRSHIRDGCFVDISEDISLGDEVVVKYGPLKDFAGIFVQEMKDADRVRILLQTVSYQAHIEIDRALVRKAN
jgi:transcription elongation factor/antiterminator RfaH